MNTSAEQNLVLTSRLEREGAWSQLVRRRRSSCAVASRLISLPAVASSSAEVGARSLVLRSARDFVHRCIGTSSPGSHHRLQLTVALLFNLSAPCRIIAHTF
jgi:hypothetical protein